MKQKQVNGEFHMLKSDVGLQLLRASDKVKASASAGRKAFPCETSLPFACTSSKRRPEDVASTLWVGACCTDYFWTGG